MFKPFGRFVSSSSNKMRAFRIALIYFVVGVVWIYLTDSLLEQQFMQQQDPHLVTVFQTYKGWLFVAGTTLLIYLLSYFAFRRQSDLQNKLADSEDIFRTLVEKSVVGVYIIQDEQFVYVNRPYQEITGYTDKELYAFPSILEIVHEDDRDLVRAKLRKRMSGEIETIQYDYCCIRKDREVINVQVHGSRMQWNDRPAVMGTMLDITDTKQYEYVLRHDRQRLRNVIDGLGPQMFAGLLKKDGTMIEVNQPALNITGIPLSDIEGKLFVDATWWSHSDSVRKQMEMAVERAANGEPSRFDTQALVKDGRIIDIDFSIQPLRDDNGNVAYLVPSANDITERVRADLKIREREQQLYLFIKHSPAALAMFDRDVRYIVVSDRWMSDYELGNQDIIGRTHYEVFPEIPERWKEIHQQCLKGAVEKCDKDSFVRANGKTEWIRWEVRPWYTADGGIGGIIMLTEVITRRIEAEARYSVMDFALNNAREGVYLIDKNARFISVNDEACRSLQYTREELLGMRIPDVDTQYPMENWSQLWEQVQESDSVRFESVIQRRDGTCFPIEVNANHFHYEETDYLMALVRDITERKESEKQIEESNIRLQQMLDANPSIIYALDVEDEQVNPKWVSGSIKRIFGYSEKEALKRDWWPTHIHPEDRARCLKNAGTIFERDRLTHEYRFLHKEGHSLWVRDELRMLRDSQGKVREIVGIWTDITERRREEEQMRLYATAFESTNDGIIVTDLGGRIETVNQSFCLMSGYQEHELIGNESSILRSGICKNTFYESMWESLQATGQWYGEVRDQDKKGEVHPYWLSISSIRDGNGNPEHYVAIYSDISKLKETEQELQQLAHYDALTQLPNRLLFHSRLEHAIERASRHDRRVGLLFMDLDNFKKVNDSHGHSVGDELLTAVSNRLRNRVRREDTLGRLGGDEFLLLLEELESPQDAATVAQDILDCLTQSFQLSGGQEVYLAASIGISIFPDDGSNMEELLQHADIAMYRAKELSHSKFRFFTSDMSEQVLENLNIETALHSAIENDELRLHFQPRVNLETGKICGAEALIRWQRQDELVSPMKFIPVAEKSGLIVPIGEWVIRKACSEIRRIIDSGLEPVEIGVNVSVKQFQHQNIDEVVQKALDEFGISPELLGLEITESTMMQNPEEAIRLLVPLKRKGVHISLDDFGTGFSNLTYLIEFPIDTLKIDTSFTRKIETDPNSLRIVTSIIDLAKNLGLNTVAEGIETENQLAFIYKHDVTEMQGHYFSKAVPAEEFETLLRSGKAIRPATTANPGIRVQ